MNLNTYKKIACQHNGLNQHFNLKNSFGEDLPLNRIITLMNKLEEEMESAPEIRSLNQLQFNTPYVHGSCLIPKIKPSDIDIFIISTVAISDLEKKILSNYEWNSSYKNEFLIQYEFGDIDLTIYKNPGSISDLRLGNISNFDNTVCFINPKTGEIDRSNPIVKSGNPKEIDLDQSEFRPTYHYNMINYKALLQFCYISLQAISTTDHSAIQNPFKPFSFSFKPGSTITSKIPQHIINLFQEKFEKKFGLPKDIFENWFETCFNPELNEHGQKTIELNDGPDQIYEAVKQLAIWTFLSQNCSSLSFKTFEELDTFYKIIRPKKTLFDDLSFLFKETSPSIDDVKMKLAQSLLHTCSRAFQKTNKHNPILSFDHLIDTYNRLPQPFNNSEFEEELSTYVQMHHFLSTHSQSLSFDTVEDLNSFYKIIRAEKTLFDDLSFLFKETSPSIDDVKMKLAQSLLNTCTRAFQKTNKDNRHLSFDHLIDTYNRLPQPFNNSEFEKELTTSLHIHPAPTDLSSPPMKTLLPDSTSKTANNDIAKEALPVSALQNNGTTTTTTTITPPKSTKKKKKKKKKTSTTKAAGPPLPPYLTWMNTKEICDETNYLQVVEHLLNIDRKTYLRDSGTLGDQLLTVESHLNTSIDHVIISFLNQDPKTLSIDENINAIEGILNLFEHDLFKDRIIPTIIQDETLLKTTTYKFQKIVLNHPEIVNDSNRIFLERAHEIFDSITLLLLTNKDAKTHKESYLTCLRNAFCLGFINTIKTIQPCEDFSNLLVPFHFDFSIISNPFILDKREEVSDILQAKSGSPISTIFLPNQVIADFHSYFEIIGDYNLSIELPRLFTRLDRLCPSIQDEIDLIISSLGNVKLSSKVFIGHSVKFNFIGKEPSKLSPKSLFIAMVLQHLLKKSTEVTSLSDQEVPQQNIQDIFDYFSSIVKDMKCDSTENIDIEYEIMCILLSQDKEKVKVFLSTLLSNLHAEPKEKKYCDILTVVKDYSKTFLQNDPSNTFFEFINEYCDNLYQSLPLDQSIFETFTTTLGVALDHINPPRKELIPMTFSKSYFEKEISLLLESDFLTLQHFEKKATTDLTELIAHCDELEDVGRKEHVFDRLKRYALYKPLVYKITKIILKEKEASGCQLDYQIDFGSISFIGDFKNKTVNKLVSNIKEIVSSDLPPSETITYFEKDLALIGKIKSIICLKNSELLKKHIFAIYDSTSHTLNIFHTNETPPTQQIEALTTRINKVCSLSTPKSNPISISTNYIETHFVIVNYYLNTKELIINKEKYESDPVFKQEINIQLSDPDITGIFL